MKNNFALRYAMLLVSAPFFMSAMHSSRQMFHAPNTYLQTLPQDVQVLATPYWRQSTLDSLMNPNDFEKNR